MANRNPGACAQPQDQRYGEAYYRTHLGEIPYDREHPHWLQFFGIVADRLIALLNPRRVLDVGCAMGFLVECFRDRGVEAFGFDISGYAISRVRTDIRPYCWLASVTDPISDQYDLITCIEVLEHVTEAGGRAAVANMTSHAGTILFSSTPSDLTEPTHVNVQPIRYWLNRFREFSFCPDVSFDPGFVAPQAMLLRYATAYPSDDDLAHYAALRNLAVEQHQNAVLQQRLAEKNTF